MGTEQDVWIAPSREFETVDLLNFTNIRRGNPVAMSKILNRRFTRGAAGYGLKSAALWGVLSVGNGRRLP